MYQITFSVSSSGINKIETRKNSVYFFKVDKSFIEISVYPLKAPTTN